MQITKNEITLTYNGVGNDTVMVSANVNEGIDTTETFTVATNDGTISHPINVNREGLREIYNCFDGDFILSDSSTFNVKKERYKDV